MVVDVGEDGTSELDTLGNDLDTVVVLDTLGDLALEEGFEFLEQDVAEIVDIGLELLVDGGEFGLFGGTGLAILDYARIEIATDDDTAE